MNNLELLKPAAIFASVVHEGSFRGAANALGLSPSVVSQSVSALEASLGTQLLYRSTRKLALTDAGEGYFQDVAQAFERLGLANESLQEQHSGPIGKLRISAPTVLASQRFAGYLREYREQNPGVLMEIDLSDDLRDAIDDHYDLIVRIAGIEETIKGAEMMFRTNGVVCAASQFRDHVASPEDLAELCWIKTPTMGHELALTLQGGGKTVSIAPKDQIVVNSGQLVRELVDEGVGFAVFPDFAIQRELQTARMFNVLENWHAGERGFFAVHSARNAKLSIAKSFVDDWKDYMARTCG